MHRNKELIRQWTLLQQVARVRDSTIPTLASDLGVSTRTIRRDLAALQEAGFPIYDATINGTKFWRIETKSLGALARSGLTFSELCALYFSRALLECFAGTHLLADVQSALGKFEAALTPQMKKFLDRLPGVVTATPRGAKRHDATTYQAIAKLLEAILHQRVVAMRYHSQASRREKDYDVHPHRLVHAQGGLYLWAFVPAYGELRTFAVERVRHVSLQEQTFTPIAELDADPFKHSMGAYRGAAAGTCKVQVRFHPRLGPYIKERSWHPSQRLKEGADGSVVLTMEVCDDYTLRSWILSFGRGARVLAPAELVEWMAAELDQAGRQYGPGGFLPPFDDEAQPLLPFGFERLATDIERVGGSDRGTAHGSRPHEGASRRR
jgi:predicted DNA-binding transcriptional regulator YafY